MARSVISGWAAAEAVGRTRRAVAPELLAFVRERVARRPPTIFDDYARDAAAAFGNPDAAAAAHEVLAAAIEGIRILDDIQDEEPQCLATEIGVDAANEVAIAALQWSVDCVAQALLPAQARVPALHAIARGIRETAIGQQLEAIAEPTFESFWNVVDRKTPPLVASALELGALAAGAPPDRALALTRLAIPLGRLLQIGDDCNDALGDGAPDRRTPHRNLLMLYTLTGPRGAELADLLQNDIRAAQLLLLREGALAYAMHAETATLDELEATIHALDLPDPSPFLRFVEQGRADVSAMM